MGYIDKVGADIARWQTAGLVTRETADALRVDIDANHGKGLGFGQVLAIMAALLMAAAILVMVAANWEAIPRLWRVGVLFALIAGSYIGGAFLKVRGSPAFAEALWLVGAASFGGAIALISQMYSISGDETQAIMVWCVGTALAALALRSPILTVAAVALAGAWVCWPVFNFSIAVSFWYIPLLAVLWAVSIWTDSIPARHLILLSLIGYALLFYFEREQFFIPVALSVISAGVFLAATRFGDETEKLTGLGSNGLAVDALIGFLTGVFTLQIIHSDNANFAWLAAMTLAAVVCALLFGGRLGRGVRWLAYLGFAVEIALIYGNTIGTMLGTAGFFLLAALGLGALAFIIIRVERRLAPPRLAATGGST